MGLLGRLFGKSKLPDGARAFAYQEDVFGNRYSIRYRFGDEEETRQCPRVRGVPSFTSLVEATKQVDALNGDGPEYRYPAGAA